MAEFNAFSIGIGADITVLQLELQRAKNLLVQFESASKKALTIGELNYSNTQIANLKNSIASLNQEIGKTGRPVGDASQSLINFSRIAQDAPYGIKGIANNLNPMIESFQRLALTEGGTKNALKAMAVGLTGPAGIGVAIGVVSSLLVSFSGEISDFFANLSSGGSSLRLFNKELELTKDTYINTLISIEKLKVSFNEYHEGVKTKKEVLAEYNTTFGKVLGTTNDINTAEETFIKNTDLYVKAMLQRAVADQAMADAGKLMYEKQKVQLTDVKEYMPVAQAGAGFISQTERLRIASKLKQDELDKIQIELDKFSELSKNSTIAYNEIVKLMLGGKTKVDEGKPEPDTTLSDAARAEKVALQEILDYRKAFADKMKAIGLTPVIEDTLSEKIAKDKERAESIAKLLAPIKERMASPTGLGGRLAVDASKRAIEYKDDDEEKKRKIKDIKDTQKAYEDFANSIANNVTGAIMGMWDALQSGESVLDSIGNMLGRLAEQLVAAALQAAIFAGIMSLLSGGVAGGGLSFAGYFMKAFGMAEGGIVTGPTHALIGEGNESEAVMPLSKLNGMLNTTFNAGAMNGSTAGSGNGQFVLRGQDLVLALQRSNSALTLRR